MRSSADRLRRLEALERYFSPAGESTLAETWPDLDERQIAAVADEMLAVILAASDRLGVRYYGELHRDHPDRQIIERAVALAAEDAAARIRSGGPLDPPPYGRDRPDVDPDYPATIDRLLVRAGWTPPKS